MIQSGIHLAESEEETEAIYRFRYNVYVEEMGRYGAAADRERRRLVEPEDETGRNYYAAQDGCVVASTRMSWGGDAPFSERLIEHYQMAPFLAEVAPEAMAVGERAMVVPELRGSELFRNLQAASSDLVQDNRIELVFGACEPHLLSLYLSQGCRTFAKKNINSPESGYLIPLVTVVEDIGYLRRIGAPQAETAVDHGDDARIPACVERLVESGGVISQRLTAGGSYLAEVQRSLGKLAQDQLSAFDNLSEPEVERALGKSNIIRCSAGDRPLKKGGVARNMFVVLEGTFEVRDGDDLIRVLSPGDVFGEMAFLLARPRTADVWAATDGRILGLSEGTLRKTIASDPEIAANLLLNIAKTLCLRVLQSS